jgi:phospholipase C
VPATLGSRVESTAFFQIVHAVGLLGKFQHVVIVVQENRTTDNLFNGLPGADTVRSGLNSKGQMVPLTRVSLSAPYDIQHTRPAFLTEYDGGKMNGFDIVRSNCHAKCPPASTRVYAYVDPSETTPYFAMAEQYAFADRMFQSNQGPSFPAHLYLVSGSSEPTVGSTLKVSENPIRPQGGHTAGCDSPPGTLGQLIDANGNESHWMYPCIDVPTLFDLQYKKSSSWRYYQAHGGPGLWNAVDAINHLRKNVHYRTNVVYPPSQFLRDTSKGDLANLSIVTPTQADSDHAGITGKDGPSWVADVVNAVGTSQYWQNSVIFVTWDDWGGWYDHVRPPIYNSYELGLRVPLIVISRFTPKGYVSHSQHEFGSILKFTEETFGLGSLNTTDARADDLADCFNFQQPPRKFVKIPAPRTAPDFLHEKVSSGDLDY